MTRLAYVGFALVLVCCTQEPTREPRSSSIVDTIAPRYSTDFARTESPISEGGRWLNGGTDGLDWTDVSTTLHRAIGHEVGASYTDATAIVTGKWRADQSATATVFNTGVRNEICVSEVELRLRSTIAPHINRGYEVAFKSSQTNKAYLIIVRWNGPLGDFTGLLETYGSQYGVKNGDVIKATIVGDRISAYKNGVEMGHASDSVYTDGNPGIGFNLENSYAACLGTNDRYGFSRFSASDALPR